MLAEQEQGKSREVKKISKNSQLAFSFCGYFEAVPSSHMCAQMDIEDEFEV
jgi:hypothetical protein